MRGINKDKVIDDLLLLVAEKNRQIKGIQETINYAIDGIEALSPHWQDKRFRKDSVKKDIQAIKQTLEGN